MYRSIWNFRANLTKFNILLDKWKKEQNLTNLELEELIKLET
jgi:hypothetical protein